MIHSMTAFGSARADVAQGTLALEIRSVNSRFLDLYFKLPEELRHVEAPLREMLTGALARGKVEVRASFVRQERQDAGGLDTQWLARLAEQYAAARAILPDLAPPRMIELMNWPGQRNAD
ncbi:MAG: YicC family protein, partial [Comamonadaceae bacterium]